MEKVKLWEILVPTHDNDNLKIDIEHHKKWDIYVQELTKGLTIQKTAKGIWLNQNETKFEESMIPVKIACSHDQIEKIADFTAKHYKQEAVMYYMLSEKVSIINYDVNYLRKTI